MTGDQEPRDFRRQIRQRYVTEFAVHGDVAKFGESLVGARRTFPSHVHVALDMFLTQAYKTHFGVRLLAERAQSEDTATLTRRLMELAIQAIYIAWEDDKQIRGDRAGCYLAWLWRSAPRELKEHVPSPSHTEWESLEAEYGPKLSKGKSWGPTFRKMFEAAGLQAVYEQDYSLLSSIAHGSPQEFALHYSMPVVSLRSDMHVPVLLVFSSRYYLAVIDAWNHIFRSVDEQQYSALFKRIADLRNTQIAPQRPK